MSAQLVIVGGGLASAKAVDAYRHAGGEDTVTLVSADQFAPYHRPPLSKRFLRGEAEREDTLVKPEAWYREQQVDLRLETRAERVDGKEVVLEGGERVPFDRLVLATGARPRTFGWPGEDLEGVFTLRALIDSAEIRDAAREEGAAVVVGAGFIGCEVAASLRTLGLDVTLVAPEDGLFRQFGCRELSEGLNELYREKGVELLLGQGISELRGNGHVETVVTSEGDELHARLCVLGLGVIPNTELGESAGAHVDNGIHVDERFESTVAGVYAAGDVANYPDPVFGRRRRIEHWSHANETGTILGQILAGEEARFESVSSFFSEVFGATIWVLGDTSRVDEVRVEGDFREQKAIAYYLEQGRLAAAAAMGQDEDTRNALKDRIRGHEELE
jgi:NADPH-dependent 2,4-dienoyl-CoA reductase/sulfur reductase-like enzyme